MLRHIKLLAIGALSALMAGCITLKNFAEQATQYNTQVADVQDATLLTNVLRAAHRIPMHFTELSTLSGTGTVSATGALTLPFATIHGGSGLFSAGPSVTASQSPTFNVAVLETQEFYNGMLKDLTAEQIGVYLQEGLPPELVFSLAFGRFVYQSGIAAEPESIENNFHKKDKSRACHWSPMEYVCFKSVLRALVYRGLTVEKAQEVVTLSPPLQEDALKDPKVLKELDAQGIQLVFIDQDACAKMASACPTGAHGLSNPERTALQNRGSFLRIQKAHSTFRLCFSPPEKPEPFANIVGGSPVAERIALAQLPDRLLCKSRVRPSDAQESREKPYTEGDAFHAQPYSLQFNESGKASFALEIQPRSTEGVIYYLGEIARFELQLDAVPNDPADQALHSLPPPAVAVDYRHSTEDTLFRVYDDRRPLPRSGHDMVVTAHLNNHDYMVRIDPRGEDRSGQVFRVVTQLLALNRSAKDFPTPTVIPLISR